MLKHIKDIWYKSWTKFLGYCQMVTAGIVYSLGEMHSYISDPTLKSYLDQMDLPKYMVAGLAMLGVLTWLAHGRGHNA